MHISTYLQIIAAAVYVVSRRPFSDVDVRHVKVDACVGRPLRLERGALVFGRNGEAGHIGLVVRPQRLPQPQSVLQLQRLKVGLFHCVDERRQQENEQLDVVDGQQIRQRRRRRCLFSN